MSPKPQDEEEIGEDELLESEQTYDEDVMGEDEQLDTERSDEEEEQDAEDLESAMQDDQKTQQPQQDAPMMLSGRPVIRMNPPGEIGVTTQICVACRREKRFPREFRKTRRGPGYAKSCKNCLKK